MVPDTSPSFKDFDEQVELLGEHDDSHEQQNHPSHDVHPKGPIHSILVDIALIFSLALLPGACCSIVGLAITFYVLNGRLENLGGCIGYKMQIHTQVVTHYILVAVSQFIMFILTLCVYFKRLRSAGGQGEIQLPTLLALCDPQNQHSRAPIARKILKCFVLMAALLLVIFTERVARLRLQYWDIHIDREPIAHDHYVHKQYSCDIRVPYYSTAHVLVAIITSWLAFASWFALLCTLCFENRHADRNAKSKAEANPCQKVS